MMMIDDDDVDEGTFKSQTHGNFVILHELK